MMKRFKKLVKITAGFVVVVSLLSPRAFAQQPASPSITRRATLVAGVFEAVPLAQEQSKGRNIASCTTGLTTFLSAGVGAQDFTDYFRDFALWPLHYADVGNVENQLNKARYAVVSAYLRCDLKRLDSVTDAYYKLDAELYFLRHYVETDGGFLHILTEGGDREKFKQDMVNYMVLKRASGDEDKDRATFSGFFDLFADKYKDRAKKYKGFGDDPVYQELGDRFDKLIENFKTLGQVEDDADKADGSDQGGSGGGESTNGQPQQASTSTEQGTLKNIKALAAAAASKFAACVDTTDNRFCLNAPGDSVADPFQPSTSYKTYQKQTYEDVKIALTKRDIKRTEDLDRATILTRYEVLYGEVNGDGIRDVTQRMDDLLATLGNGKPKSTNPDVAAIAGSLQPLNLVDKCVQFVQENECK